LPEVAGDAALLVPPTDVEALASALQQAMSDAALRSRLIQAGFERARLFSWDTAARELSKIYRRLAG
jgi:glycosyltransferase involved in cell wall biosynthesis